MDLPALRPNIAGLTSPVQQAEMAILLAGRWPALKPLPIFKFETDDYRATIEFDKTRGEWVCRKTSLPSNKVKELRGGLTEITMALPRGHAQVPAESNAAEQQEQESEKEASRRLQAILEWRENYENGAFYSGLQRYLSKSQKEEIDASIRLTLTARQLQFNPKNVADVFDALLKAGGKLATLIETAQRNNTEQRADVAADVPVEVAAIPEIVVPSTERNLLVGTIQPPLDRRLQMRATLTSSAYTALDEVNGGVVLNISETGMAVAATDALLVADYLPQVRFRLPNLEQRIKVSAQVVWLADSKKRVGIQFVDLSTEVRHQIANWIASEKPSPELVGLAAAPAERILPAAPESVSEEPMWIAVPEQAQHFVPELISRTASRPSELLTPETRDASPSVFLDDLPIEAEQDGFAPGLGPRIRADRSEWPANRTEDSSLRSFVREMSGLQIAALVLLSAFIILAVGLTAGRSALALLRRDTEKSLTVTDHTSQALLSHLRERSSQPSTTPAPDASVTPAVNPPGPATSELHSESPAARSFNPPAEDSTPSVAPIGPSPAMTTPPLPDSHNSETSSERDGSTELSARNAPPADSQPAPRSRAVIPKSAAPASPAPRAVMPATRPAPRLSPPATILFTARSDGSKPFRLILPERPLAASSSFAISSQLSVLVAPDRARAPAQEPARLQAGELVSFAWPRYPRPGERHGSSETVKVRTTIGEFGQVLDVKRVSGSFSLLPAAISAIRLWRFKPTLLNDRPVQAQQDVTIEFRSPRRVLRTPTRYSARR